MDIKDILLKEIRKTSGLTALELAKRLFGSNAKQQKVNNACKTLWENGHVKRARIDGKYRYSIGEPKTGPLSRKSVVLKTQAKKLQSKGIPVPDSERSSASKKREAKRNSSEIKAFRDRIELLLKDADQHVAYRIRQDLKVMTDMPYWNKKFEKPKDKSLSKYEAVSGYIVLLEDFNGPHSFKIKLLGSLIRNQGQTIRKLSERHKHKVSGHDKWEHAIPAAYLIKEIIQWIQKEKSSHLFKLLQLYELAGQVSVTKEEDESLKKAGLHCRMPEGWDWRKKGVDIYARYHKVGIDITGRLDQDRKGNQHA